MISAIPSCAQQHISTTAENADYNAGNDVNFTSIQQDILKYINIYRQSKGLPALQMNEAATTEAVKHSTDMANGTLPFGHDAFDTRMKNITAKEGFLHGGAENVAYGKVDAKEVVDMWLKSPGHRENIEGNFTFTGIGIAQRADGYLFFTQIFFRK